MQTRELQFDLMRRRTNHEFDTLNHVEVIPAYDDSAPATIIAIGTLSMFDNEDQPQIKQGEFRTSICGLV